MESPEIDLVFFEGCPNVDRARASLRAALGGAGVEGGWREWDLRSEATPERLRRYGSPTVLVDGRDVTGEEEGSQALACRAAGAPPPELIREALARRR